MRIRRGSGDALSSILQFTNNLLLTISSCPLPRAQANVVGTELTPILRLPHEIICNIAFHISYASPCQESSDLSNFCSINRKIRIITSPILFREIRVSWVERLYELSQWNGVGLGYIRELYIDLNLPFFRDLRKACKPHKLRRQRVVLSLCRLLQRLPLLRTLSVTLVPGDRESEWRYRTRADRVVIAQFGSYFEQAMSSLAPKDTQWLCLTRLRLEGLANIGLLLLRCPNLKQLDLSTWDGFHSSYMPSFIEDFKLVPQLESPSFSPGSELDHFVPDQGWDWGCFWQIGAALPKLRHLDLRTRGFLGVHVEQMSLWYPVDPYDSIINAIPHFPQLATLTLPFNFRPLQWPITRFHLYYSPLSMATIDNEHQNRWALSLAAKAQCLEKLAWIQASVAQGGYVAAYKFERNAVSDRDDDIISISSFEIERVTVLTTDRSGRQRQHVRPAERNTALVSLFCYLASVASIIWFLSRMGKLYAEGRTNIGVLIACTFVSILVVVLNIVFAKKAVTRLRGG